MMSDLYDVRITEKHICVLDEETHGTACFHDSGGPMMCGCEHNVQAGITSYGEQGGHCSGRLPVVYMRVSKYRDWIYQHTGV